MILELREIRKRLLDLEIESWAAAAGEFSRECRLEERGRARGLRTARRQLDALIEATEDDVTYSEWPPTAEAT